MTKIYSLPDNDLDEAAKVEHPNDGEVLVTSRLLAKGIRIPLLHVQAFIHHVNPINTMVVSQVCNVGMDGKTWFPYILWSFFILFTVIDINIC